MVNVLFKIYLNHLYKKNKKMPKNKVIVAINRWASHNRCCAAVAFTCQFEHLSIQSVYSEKMSSFLLHMQSIYSEEMFVFLLHMYNEKMFIFLLHIQSVYHEKMFIFLLHMYSDKKFIFLFHMYSEKMLIFLLYIQSVYSEAAALVTKHPDVQNLLGLDLKCYGEETRRGRRTHVRWVDNCRVPAGMKSQEKS